MKIVVYILDAKLKMVCSAQSYKKQNKYNIYIYIHTYLNILINLVSKAKLNFKYSIQIFTTDLTSME